jgi:hypothetical protein
MCACVCVRVCARAWKKSATIVDPRLFMQAALSHFESTYEDEREKEWVKSDFEMLVTK